MARLATLTCWVVGVLLVVAGVLTAVFGEPGDQHHNLVHLATGLVALVAGVSRDRSAARTFCVVSGAGYLTFGGIGFLLGDPQADRLWTVGLLHLAAAEHVLHLVLGGVVLAAGLFPARRPATHDAAADPATAHRAVVGGLLVAAAGAVTMAIGGVAFTTAVPPGLLILLIPAGLVAAGRGRWASVLAGVAALLIVVGYIPSGAIGQLFDPVASGAFVGSWLQFGGASLVVVAAAVAVMRDPRVCDTPHPGPWPVLQTRQRVHASLRTDMTSSLSTMGRLDPF